MNQWRNTQEAISWFKGIENKGKELLHQIRHCGFLSVDFERFVNKHHEIS